MCFGKWLSAVRDDHAFVSAGFDTKFPQLAFSDLFFFERLRA